MNNEKTDGNNWIVKIQWIPDYIEGREVWNFQTVYFQNT